MPFALSCDLCGMITIGNSLTFIVSLALSVYAFAMRQQEILLIVFPFRIIIRHMKIYIAANGKGERKSVERIATV